jgi:hypothetical protein
MRYGVIKIPLVANSRDRAAIPNSERVYVFSADQVPSVELDLNDKSKVSGSENFEFGIAGDRVSARSNKVVLIEKR